MAGWSKRVDGSGLESFRSLENVDNASEFMNKLLKEVNGCLCFRPFPPMLGNGKTVDLCKLYLVVREKGGYQRVCTSGCWGVVAKECGFDSTFGLALKLVYVKYLDVLNRAMLKVEQVDDGKSDVRKSGGSGFDAVRMGFGLDLKEVLMKLSDEKKKGARCGVIEFSNGIQVQDFAVKRSLNDNVCDVKGIDERRSVVYAEENSKFTRKRKQESYLDMLNWVTELAKDPCDPAIGHIPERSKWKSYGNEVVWKKVLLLRGEMLLEKNVDTSTQFSIWQQQKQKMHPSMYDDNCGSEQLRCSQRVLSAKDSLKNSASHIDGTLMDGSSDSSAVSGVWCNRRRKKIASIGSEFQADIPEWKNDSYESDSKWLGTQIWPLDKSEQRRMLIERDPIGKGREDTCGCEYPGSYDCIRFHLSEKQRKLKLELGSAFYHWEFDCMGEKVALSWTAKDEQTFNDIVKSRPLPEDESYCYWPEVFTCLPHKSRESLVSYYFNVFLLRRIGQQNRMNASDVDSDDDESGYGPRSICFGRDPKFSILCSPKKARLDPRQ